MQPLSQAIVFSSVIAPNTCWAKSGGAKPSVKIRVPRPLTRVRAERFGNASDAPSPHRIPSGKNQRLTSPSVATSTSHKTISCSGPPKLATLAMRTFSIAWSFRPNQRHVAKLRCERVLHQPLGGGCDKSAHETIMDFHGYKLASKYSLPYRPYVRRCALPAWQRRQVTEISLAPPCLVQFDKSISLAKFR
jgi:hypothetical protein